MDAPQQFRSENLFERNAELVAHHVNGSEEVGSGSAFLRGLFGVKSGRVISLLGRVDFFRRQEPKPFLRASILRALDSTC